MPLSETRQRYALRWYVAHIERNTFLETKIRACKGHRSWLKWLSSSQYPSWARYGNFRIPFRQFIVSLAIERMNLLPDDFSDEVSLVHLSSCASLTRCKSHDDVSDHSDWFDDLVEHPVDDQTDVINQPFFPTGEVREFNFSPVPGPFSWSISSKIDFDDCETVKEDSEDDKK